MPFRELTEQERDIVFDGPAEKKHIFYKAKNSNQAGELDFTYFNAVYTVENAQMCIRDRYRCALCHELVHDGRGSGRAGETAVKAGKAEKTVKAAKTIKAAGIAVTVDVYKRQLERGVDG